MYFIIIALMVLAAYLGVLVLEARRVGRYFEVYRLRLDRVAEQTRLIVTHVDLAGFVRDETLRAVRYLVHQGAHMALQVVRAAERLLTRLVRHLRLHPEAPHPGGESNRSFVRALSEFKGQLEAGKIPGRPEMPEVR